MLLWAATVTGLLVIAQQGHLFDATAARIGLGAALGGATANVVDRLPVDTGCRIGELLSLRWSDVRPDAIVLRAENAKTVHARGADNVADARGARFSKGRDVDSVRVAATRQVMVRPQLSKEIKRAWVGTTQPSLKSHEKFLGRDRERKLLHGPCRERLR